MTISVKWVGMVAGGLLLATTTACGGSGGSASPEQTVTAAPPSTAEKLTLKQACPKMETALLEAGGDEWLPLPTTAQADQFNAAIDKLIKMSDEETLNAVDGLNEEVRLIAATNPSAGQETLDADAQLSAAVQMVADRCKAVGSSAFQ